MKTITYVTGNLYKFQIAQKILNKKGIKVEQEKLETPEIQSTNLVEIASFSAKWATEKLGKPVVLTDVGYFIEALNGFPGPFIKYINEWLTAENLLRLMEDKKNRKVIIRACLAYCEPKKEPITFIGEVTGTIAEKAVKTDKGWITSINELFIPKGFNGVESEIPKEEMIKFWGKLEIFWEKLADYLLRKT